MRRRCPYRESRWCPPWKGQHSERRSAMAAVLAFAAAVLYGSADFLGGVGSRRASALSFLAASAPVGAVIMLAAALATGGPVAAGRLGWGFAAGAVSGVGVIVFFAGLAAGPISVVALSRGAAVPGLGNTSEPGKPALPGRGRLPAAGGVACGLAAGVAFGLYFLFIRNAAQAGGLWPLAISRWPASTIVLVTAARRDHRPVLPRASRGLSGMALAAGAEDVAASLLYVLAVRSGPFARAAVMTALYPAVTVLHARLVLGERMRAVQRAGLALGALGIILVTA